MKNLFKKIKETVGSVIVLIIVVALFIGLIYLCVAEGLWKTFGIKLL